MECRILSAVSALALRFGPSKSSAIMSRSNNDSFSAPNGTTTYFHSLLECWSAVYVSNMGRMVSLLLTVAAR